MYVTRLNTRNTFEHSDTGNVCVLVHARIYSRMYVYICGASRYVCDARMYVYTYVSV